MITVVKKSFIGGGPNSRLLLQCACGVQVDFFVDPLAAGTGIDLSETRNVFEIVSNGVN